MFFDAFKAVNILKWQEELAEEVVMKRVQAL